MGDWLRLRFGKQGVEGAGAIKLVEFIATADVVIANEDLRHSAPTGERNHLITLRRVKVNTQLLNAANPLAAQ